MFFFFSSRRRHTRCGRDWSSDVCSSDLLWDVMDGDTWERIRTTFTGLEWRRELAQFPKLAVRSVAFRNNGDLTFSDVGERWGFGVGDAISHGMALADLDGGRGLDVVVSRVGSPVALVRDRTSATR